MCGCVKKEDMSQEDGRKSQWPQWYAYGTNTTNVANDGAAQDPSAPEPSSEVAHMAGPLRRLRLAYTHQNLFFITNHHHHHRSLSRPRR